MENSGTNEVDKLQEDPSHLAYSRVESLCYCTDNREGLMIFTITF